MAGEARGKALEAIVRYAVESARSAPWPSDAQMVWDAPVDALLWKPDLLIMPSGQFSGLCAMVTYSGSENDSQQKFWRSLCELIDAHAAFPNAALVSIIAGGRLRAKFREAHRHIFHRVFEFEEHADNSSVDGWLSALSITGISADDRLALVAQLSAAEPEFAGVVSALGRCICGAPGSVPELHRSFWLPVSGAGLPVPEARETHFRRGIAKAALLDAPERAEFRRGGKLARRDCHGGLVTAEILGRAIGGLVLRDSEVRFALDHVRNLDQVIELGLTEVGASSRRRVRDLGVVQGAIEWCSEHWEELADRERFSAILDTAMDGVPAPHYFLQAVKASLAVRLGRQGQAWLEHVADLTGEVKSVLIGLVIPKFERGQGPLPSHVREGISVALSERCAGVDSLGPAEIEDCIEAYVRKEIETRLVCHGIDGVGTIVRVALEAASVPFDSGWLCSGLAERLGFSRRDFALTSGILAGETTFIHWRTVTDQGRDHKAKEIAARAYQSRRSWERGRFSMRSVPSRCLLVVDGTWRDKDLSMLHAYGWDGIYYPDEMDRLLSAVL